MHCAIVAIDLDLLFVIIFALFSNHKPIILVNRNAIKFDSSFFLLFIDFNEIGKKRNEIKLRTDLFIFFFVSASLLVLLMFASLLYFIGDYWNEACVKEMPENHLIGTSSEKSSQHFAINACAKHIMRSSVDRSRIGEKKRERGNQTNEEHYKKI